MCGWWGQTSALNGESERVFTGIVEATGVLVDVVDLGEGRALVIDAGVVAEDLPIGGSVAVNGACLTAVEVSDTRFRVEAITETLRRTNLGGLEPGQKVNLERAMPAGGRFDGHVVQGHVDGVGLVASIAPDGTGVKVSVSVAEELMRYIVEKGSITVDGVSLTVAGLNPGGFDIALIPHTLEVTTFGELEVGDAVNLEVDILAKYVERLLEFRT